MLSWRTLKRFGTAALAPAVLMFAAVPAFAQRGHGGGHGGGFHAGGYHGGGYRAGAYRGFSGYRGGAYRGFSGYRGYGYRPYYGGYYGRGYGWRGYGLGYGLLGYGLGYGLGGYGLGGYGLGGYGYPYSSYYGSTSVYAPSYAGYSSYYPPVDTTGYVAPADYGLATSPDYAAPADYGQTAPSGYAAPAEDNEAHITIVVPPDATVWFDGDQTTQTGPAREFVSPPLAPGQTYTYHVRARWTENGRPVEQERDIHVRANQQTIENFVATAGTANRAPAGAAQMPPARD